MSHRATDWASRQRLHHATDKLLLWALADAEDGRTGTTYPSTAALCEFTGMGRTAILEGLARLVERKLIEDTGERRGRTRQVKVWRLALDSAKTSASRTLKASAIRTVKGSVSRTLSAVERVRHPDTEPSYRDYETSTAAETRPPKPSKKPAPAARRRAARLQAEPAAEIGTIDGGPARVDLDGDRARELAVAIAAANAAEAYARLPRWIRELDEATDCSVDAHSTTGDHHD